MYLSRDQISSALSSVPRSPQSESYTSTKLSWQGRQSGQEEQARQAGAGLFWRRTGHLEQPWTSSWRWNDDFRSPWTSSWLWNGGFGDPLKSSWPWKSNVAIVSLFSYDFRQFRKACEPSEAPCLSTKTEVQPFVL